MENNGMDRDGLADWSALEPCVALLALQGVSRSIGSTWVVECPASALIHEAGLASGKWMEAFTQDGSIVEHAKHKSMGSGLARFMEALGCEGGRVVCMSIQTGEWGGSCLWIELESLETYAGQKKADQWAKKSADWMRKALEAKGVEARVFEMNMEIPDEAEFVGDVLARRRAAWERSAIDGESKESACSQGAGKSRL